MNVKKILGFWMFLLFVTLLLSMVSGYVRTDNPNSRITYELLDSVDNFDKSVCKDGKDFLVQVVPLSCTPAIVRSDLLEEQNVNVFCQLGATKINPLINVKGIKNLDFSGDFPPEVSSVRYYPGRASLGVEGRENTPFLDNIGYVVITLRQNSNESEMPDFVEGNLSVRLNYDGEEAYGVGRAQFYLPQLTDEKWENDGFKEYGFWGGKGYLRVENVEENSAEISLYDGDLRKISRFDLEEGQSSESITIPDFDFCSGDMSVRLDGLENPDTKARLLVNGQAFEFSEGERFLDGACRVQKIESAGLSQRVEIRCNEDTGRSKFELRIEPRVNLTINDVKGEYERGDVLYDFHNIILGDRKIFLGYVGEDSNGDAFIVPVVSSAETKEEFLDTPTAKELHLYVGSALDSASGGFVQRSLSHVWNRASVLGFTGFFGLTGSFPIGFYWKGEEPNVRLSHLLQEIGGEKVKKYFDNRPKIMFNDFAGGSDFDLEDLADKLEGGDNLLDYYLEADRGYADVVQKYFGENFVKGEKTTIDLDEAASYNLISLAGRLQQKMTLAELCRDFRIDYPDSDKDLKICDEDFRTSSKEIATKLVSVRGKFKEIVLDGISEPDFEDYGVEVLISNAGDYSGSIKVRKNQDISLSDDEYVTFKEIRNEQAVFEIGRIKQDNAEDFLKGSNLKIGLDGSETFGDADYRIKVLKINLKKYARVSVVPDISKTGSDADFSFKVGIEKRNFKLSPEETRDRIEKLNKTITALNEISENLGKVNEGLQKACAITGTILTAKNLLENLGGKGIARQKIMRGNGGWFERCVDMVDAGQFSTQEECLIKNSDKIDKDVEEVNKIIEEQNSDIKEIQEKHTTDSGFLGDKVVDTEKFVGGFAPSVRDSLDAFDGNSCDAKLGDTSKLSGLLSVDAWKKSNYGVEQLREIDLNLRIIKSSANQKLKESSRNKLCSLFADVQVNSNNYNDKKGAEDEYGVPVVFGREHELSEIIPISQDVTFEQVKNKFGNNCGVDDSDFVQIYVDRKSSQEYLLVLDKDYIVTKTCIIDENSKDLIELDEANPWSVGFEKVDSSSYKNKFKSSFGGGAPVVRYFETEPYKGFPALVPFDLDNGWYAATKQTIPIGGNIKTFDASGRVNSFMLCNVGRNGIEEFSSGLGDDRCTGINLGTGHPYDQIHGLSEQESRTLVTRAVKSIEDASRQYDSGVSGVVVEGKRIKVGSPALDIPDIQCQDFMSPKECTLLFNLCDPVLCPSSRCDLGGEYPVRDVIQSGVIGSLALCLPNLKEGVVVPICLTGVKAGLDYWNSNLESYQQCLQTSLDTGQTVGICDEIHSVYMCEMFWKEALPIANVAIPKIIGAISGENVRGGGEYLSVKDALSRAQNSFDFLTQNYAGESRSSFRIRSTAEAGTEICKSFPSLVLPNSADLLNSVSLTETPSPPQFSARFDEIPLTDVTAPPISHYKVFYHIYAGENQGAYYKVFLKADSSSFYQDVASTKIVASGFIPAGEFATDTKDFQQPSGYRELCVSVNGNEECGFQEVSTSFAVDYVKDRYLESQASGTQITSEAECISGTIFDLPSEVVSPDIYNRNIIRICATDDPGVGSDPLAKTENARWRDVGYCGNEKLRCFLDSESVEESIKSTKVEEGVLNKTANNYLDVLSKSEGFIEDIDGEIREIESESDNNEKIKRIDSILDKIFFVNKRGYLELLRADAYGDLAVRLFDGLVGGEIGGKVSKDDKIIIGGEISGEEGDKNKICFLISGDEKETCGGRIKILEGQKIDISLSYEENCDPKYNLYEEAIRVSSDEKIYSEDLDLDGIQSLEKDFSGLNVDFGKSYYFWGICSSDSKKIAGSPIFKVLDVPDYVFANDIDLLNRYFKYDRKFDENAFVGGNLPERWESYEFKALLVAIAQEESEFKDGELLMGYGKGDSENEDAETQIELASKELMLAFNSLYGEPDEALPEEYGECHNRALRKTFANVNIISKPNPSCEIRVYLGLNNEDLTEEQVEIKVKRVNELRKFWKKYFKEE